MPRRDYVSPVERITHPPVRSRPSFRLMVSSSSDRSSSAPLPGTTLTGNRYIFVASEADITAVSFYLDGVFERTEVTAPFDFKSSAGGAGDPANPWDASAVANGTHTIRADVTASGRVYSVSATFTTSGAVVVTGVLGMANTYDATPNAWPSQSEWYAACAGYSSGYSGPTGGGYAVTRVTSPAINSHACAFELPSLASGTHRQEWGSFGKFEKYVTRYFGLSFRLGANWNWNAVGYFGAAISQWNQNGGYACPTMLNLGGPIDSILSNGVQPKLTVTYQTGRMPGWDSPPLQYTGYATVIPTVSAATWYDVIVGIYITDWDNGSGRVDSWWRVRGAPSWTQGVSIVGKPTLQYFTEGAAPSRRDVPGVTTPNVAHYSQKWGYYRGGGGSVGTSPAMSMAAGTAYYHDNCVRGTTFEVVDAMLTSGGPSVQYNVEQNPPA